MEKILQPLKNSLVRHHDTGFSAKGVTWFSIGLIVMLLLAGALMLGLMRMFDGLYSAGPPSPTPEVRQRASETPALETNSTGNIERLRRREDRILDRYGWVDRSAGIVQIPIARAMELIAERGLAPREHPLEPPPTKAEPTLPPPQDSSVGGIYGEK